MRRPDRPEVGHAHAGINVDRLVVGGRQALVRWRVLAELNGGRAQVDPPRHGRRTRSRQLEFMPRNSNSSPRSPTSASASDQEDGLAMPKTGAIARAALLAIALIIRSLLEYSTISFDRNVFLGLETRARKTGRETSDCNSRARLGRALD